jgi:hypothetical protein
VREEAADILHSDGQSQGSIGDLLTETPLYLSRWKKVLKKLSV